MQKSGISDKFGEPYIKGINVSGSGAMGDTTESADIIFTNQGPVLAEVTGDALGQTNIALGLDAAKSRTALGLGTAALINTGTASGQIPVLDASGKLPESVIGDIALYDKFDIASANNINDIVTFINGITTGTTPKRGDMIFVLSGNARGTYWITITKTPGTYTANDISGLATPSGTVDSVTFLGTNYTPTNGIITLPANIGWNSLTGIPTASTTASGIVKLNDSTSSTSTTEAATANAVYKCYNRGIAYYIQGNTGGMSSDNSQNLYFTLYGSGPIYVSVNNNINGISLELDKTKLEDFLLVKTTPDEHGGSTIPKTWPRIAEVPLERQGKLDRSFMPRNIIGFAGTSNFPPTNPPSDFIQGFAFTARGNGGSDIPGFSVSVFDKYYPTGETWKGINYILNSSTVATSGPRPVIPATGTDGKLDASFIPDGVGGINIVNADVPGTTLTAKTLRIGGLDGLGVSIAPTGPSSSEINIFYGLEETSFKSYLTNTIGIKTAAYQNTGTTNGTIPLIGANNKLPVSIIPDEVGGNFSSFTINNGYGVSQLVGSNPNEITFWKSPFYIGPYASVDLVNYLQLDPSRGVVLSQNLTDRAALHWIKTQNEGASEFTTYYCGPVLTFRAFSFYTNGPFIGSISNNDYTGSHPGQTRRNAYTEIQIDPYYSLRQIALPSTQLGASSYTITPTFLPKKFYFRPSALSATNTLVINVTLDFVLLDKTSISETKLIIDPTTLTANPQNIQIILSDATYRLFIDQGDVGTLDRTKLYLVDFTIYNNLVMVKYSSYTPI